MPTDAVLTLGEFVGIAIGAYGLLCENFVTLVQERPFGEGHYREDP